jgi:hypothetical protein
MIFVSKSKFVTTYTQGGLRTNVLSVSIQEIWVKNETYNGGVGKERSGTQRKRVTIVFHYLCLHFTGRRLIMTRISFGLLQ